MSHNKTLYAKLIFITTDYLGPASKRFIDRQIQNHLQKDPEQLNNNDIITLSRWASLAMAMLTENNAITEEYQHRIMSITHSK
ncbi:MAG: hypothetical protein NVSMB46_05730 [Candidatus Saccharimonadales bacterium]